jgi:hypothetical protein
MAGSSRGRRQPPPVETPREQNPAHLAWEGRVGSIPLRIEVPHAGKIFAEWQSPNGNRSKFSKSIEEFEKSVLFQLVISEGEAGMAAAEEALKAVALAEAERPAPVRQEAPRKKGKQKVRQHRRSRRPARR